MAPPELFLAINCTNVGVGPGGTTNLLACVLQRLFSDLPDDLLIIGKYPL